MDDRFLPARDAANAFWTKVAYISLDVSLSKKQTAISKLDATTADARLLASTIYESKLTLADEAYMVAVGAAMRVRDESCATALEAYARSIEGPTAIFEAAKKTNDDFSAKYNSTCANVLRLAKALAQEEFEVATIEAQNDEEREQELQVRDAALQAAQETFDESVGTGIAMWNAKHRESSEAFNQATASARTTCREVTEAYNATFDAESQPAKQIQTDAVREASEQRDARLAEIDAEHEHQFDQIESQYAIERRLRVACLRTSRICVDAYYNWLSAFTPPESKF